MNQGTFNFILEYEESVSPGEQVIVDELIKLFEQSRHYNEIIRTYIKPPKNSMWYAIKRSEKWKRVKPGVYKKV
ncbi:MAG: hypothetical protein R3250_08070 [Melioribacteraceae bacterium]|nr:hypothetical protein [Melioribacteraceae bacterium]